MEMRKQAIACACWTSKRCASKRCASKRLPASKRLLRLLVSLTLCTSGAQQLWTDGGALQAGVAAGRMIWMMQGKYEMDLSFLRSEHSDALQVVWGAEPSGRYNDAYYLPRSTCTEGRNYLLQLAYEKGVARGEQVCVYILYVFV
jgi:hypothetical protein